MFKAMFKANLNKDIKTVRDNQDDIKSIKEKEFKSIKESIFSEIKWKDIEVGDIVYLK